MQNIAIGTLGGTIAMVSEEGAGGKPSLGARDLVAAVPELDGLGEFVLENLAQLPSASLSFMDLLAAFQWAEAQIEAGAQAVILTQGTDTIEETAFFFHLYWKKQAPLIITGAMRMPFARGADGPANLLAAVRVACSPLSAQSGVLVVLNETIHSPYWIQKTDSSAVETFRSPQMGPLGRVIEDRVVYFHTKRFGGHFLSLPMCLDHKIALYSTALAAGADHLKLILEAGLYQGVVISGFGAGHLSFAEAEVAKAYATSLPIIMATRCQTGETARATYGYNGSEMDLLQAGVMMAGFLSPLKARLLLWALKGTPKTLGSFSAHWHEWTLA